MTSGCQAAFYAIGSANGGLNFPRHPRQPEQQSRTEIESYKQAIRIDPDNAAAHYCLGVAYVLSGKYKKAIKSYKQAIRIDPDDADAHFNLGLTYIILKDRGSAIEQYKILKKLDTEKANELFNDIYE